MNIFKASYLIFGILFLFQNPAITLVAESIVAADIVEGTKTSKNYLKAKSHFEKTANGWNGYDDGGATRPVNGTGGTVTTTCTRTTSNPLSGVGSLIMTKGAANYQGEGCSVDFTVDSKDKAKVLQVEFDYIVSSGSFTAGTSSTDSDVIVYLYDVTNAVLIEPSTFKLYSSSTTIHDKFIGNFQTASNSTSYRLILHIASSANTSAMVVAFDDFKVSPSNYVYGTPITDWQSYTPTAGATNITATGYYRRVGDSLEARVQLTATGVPVGNITASLPSGLTIDTTKFAAGANAQKLGIHYMENNAIAGYDGLVYYASTTTVGFAIGNSSGTYDVSTGVTASVPFSIDTGDFIRATFSAPITGWSSSSQQSDGYDGRLIAARYTTSSQALGNTTIDTVILTTKDYDTTNSYSTSTGLFTCPTSGWYDVSFIATTGVRTSTTWDITNYIYVNSSVKKMSNSYTQYSSGIHLHPIHLSDTFYCNAGDTISGRIRAGYSGAALDNSAYQNVLTIKKVASPTTISATETVAARYTSGAGQSIANAATPIVDFATKDYDTHGAVTTGASWKFTAPVAGLYSVKAFVRYGNTLAWTAGQYVSALLYKNGASFSTADTLMQATITPGQAPSAQLIDSVWLNAGDYIDIRTAHGESAARALVAAGTLVRVAIEKIK